jgi:hypothetical protein
MHGLDTPLRSVDVQPPMFQVHFRPPELAQFGSSQPMPECQEDRRNVSGRVPTAFTRCFDQLGHFAFGQVYAAIVWLHHHVKLPPVGICIISGITVLAAIWQIVLLIRFQRDLLKLRLRAQTANATFYPEAERKGLDLATRYEFPFWRGWEVLVALICVSVIGAFLVILVLNLPPLS